jgi:flagellar motor switch protein FliG
LRKAAIFLVTLDDELASQLLEHLGSEATEALHAEIDRLEEVSGHEQRSVIEEFARLCEARGAFEFDDLGRMSEGDFGELFRTIELGTWTDALAGASKAVREAVISKLDLSSGRELSRSLAVRGPYRLSDAEAAQMEILERVRLLFDAGRIELPAARRSEDERVGTR